MTTETKFTVGEYKTRDGRDVTISVVRSDGKPVGAMTDHDGTWWPQMWNADGSISPGCQSPADLTPRLREWWVVMRMETHEIQSWHDSLAGAEKSLPKQMGFGIGFVREVRDDQA